VCGRRKRCIIAKATGNSGSRKNGNMEQHVKHVGNHMETTWKHAAKFPGIPENFFSVLHSIFYIL